MKKTVHLIFLCMAFLLSVFAADNNLSAHENERKKDRNIVYFKGRGVKRL